MNTTKKPYELLIRWDQEGKLAGAHVQYRFVITDGDAVVAESVGQAEPLSLAGFPLSEVLSTAQADALAECESLRTSLAASQLALAETQKILSAAQFDLSTAHDALMKISAEKS